jgi:hypothetical protein
VKTFSGSNDVTSPYHAAVSSIEAIAHTAAAAGASEETVSTLPSIFRLKYVYYLLKHKEEGGRPPKAIRMTEYPGVLDAADETVSR